MKQDNTDAIFEMTWERPMPIYLLISNKKKLLSKMTVVVRQLDENHLDLANIVRARLKGISQNLGKAPLKSR